MSLEGERLTVQLGEITNSSEQREERKQKLFHWNCGLRMEMEKKIKNKPCVAIDGRNVCVNYTLLLIAIAQGGRLRETNLHKNNENRHMFALHEVALI